MIHTVKFKYLIQKPGEHSDFVKNAIYKFLPKVQQQHSEAWHQISIIKVRLYKQTLRKPRGYWIKKLIKKFEVRLRLHLRISRLCPNFNGFNLINSLRQILSLIPLDVELQQSGVNIMRLLNAQTYKTLEAYLADTNRDLVVIAVGCKSRMNQLRRTILLFDATQNVKVIGVVGDSSLPDWKIKYDVEQQILTLPINDNYEGLPLKMAWACLVLSICKYELNILKVDDDSQPDLLINSFKLLEETQQKDCAAAGYPITQDSPLHLDRGWHIGKSSKKANLNVYSNLGIKCWMSGGTGYLLTSTAISRVAAYTLHTWGFIQGMVYEDIAITKIIDSEDLRINWIEDPISLGITNERINEIKSGQWSFERSKLSNL